MFRWKLALLIGLLGPCLPAAQSGADDSGTAAPPTLERGHVYFVAANGDDSNLGTQAAPWRTLQRAANAVKPGDTVAVRAGSYKGFVLGWDSPQSGTAEARIVFKADRGAVISSRNNKTADGVDLEGTSYVTIDGFAIVSDGSISHAGIRSARNNHVIIRNNKVDGCGNWGIFTSFSDELLIEGNVASHAHKEHGIYVSNTCVAPIVRGNRVFGNRQCGIHLNGDVSQGGKGVITDALIEGNIIYDNGTAGGSAINCDGVRNSRIQNNLIYENHANGISLYRIDAAAASIDNLVVNNTIVMADDSRWAVNIKNRSVGNAVYNNILINKNPSHGSINLTADSASGLYSDYNLLDGRVSPDDDEVIKLSAWQHQTGHDLHSTVAKASELFINEAGGDYHLAGSSPAIGKGSSLPPPRQAPQADLEGHQRPIGGPGIGAFVTEGVAGGAGVSGGMLPFMIAGACCGIVLLVFVVRFMRRKALDRWLIPYAWHICRTAPRLDRPIHMLLCIADHFEPHNGGVSDMQADERVGNWVEKYPQAAGEFRDEDGRVPQHTFFYPIEQYHAGHIRSISSLCRGGFGEVEIHLHHDHDTADNLRKTLLHYARLFHERDGLLSRHRHSGDLAYGFIHGNWALDNSGPHGRWCGVNNELDVLRETGCYADFTLPAVPSRAQTRQINSIYYAVDDPLRPKSHNRGTPVGAGVQPERALMLIQGPLVLDWQRRKYGILPRIENGCIQANQPLATSRIDAWLKASVRVSKRPDWFFVKLHTHGAPEPNQQVLLGDAMRRFHAGLARRASADPLFHFHYVTAREMYNLARAAECGLECPVSQARDFELIGPHRAAASLTHVEEPTFLSCRPLCN